jgi:hypothetical protein
VSLLDHFHPPLAATRHWESFHGAWAAEIMALLNREVLPPGFFAEAQVHVGSRVEIDVASFEQEAASASAANGNSGGVAIETWAPPATALVMPTVFPDEIEIQIFGTATGPTLVAAVELVSPGNKDRPESRRSFAAKCAAYLQMGIGLVVVDIVTERQANLHDDLIELLKQPAGFRFPGSRTLYASAYRPRRRSAGDEIDIWLSPLELRMPLPVMPLALRGGPTLPLDLESSYNETIQRSRL